jgi:hypothetical protein
LNFFSPVVFNQDCAQCLHECQQKIAAEERAAEHQAEITEARRARVAERAFSVAEKSLNTLTR